MYARPTHRLSKRNHPKQPDHTRVEELPHHCYLLEQLHPLIRLQGVLGHFHGHLHTACGGLPLSPVHVTKLPLPQGLPQMDRTSGELLVPVLGHLPIDLIHSGSRAPELILGCCLKHHRISNYTVTCPGHSHWLAIILILLQKMVHSQEGNVYISHNLHW